jgi:5-methylcytosine-specific restriction endonuclease McrA
MSNTAEARREQKAAYYQKNKDKIRARQKEHYEENKDKLLAKQKERYAEKRDEICGKARQYRAVPENKLRKALHNGAKRARARNVTVIEDIQADEQYAYWEANEISKDHCRYCGISFEGLAAGEATIDHVKPLIDNGPHTVENIVPACLSCNSSKNDKESYDI